MIGYRVDDLDALLANLAAAGVWIDESARTRAAASSPGSGLRRQPARALAAARLELRNDPGPELAASTSAMAAASTLVSASWAASAFSRGVARGGDVDAVALARRPRRRSPRRRLHAIARSFRSAASGRRT